MKISKDCINGDFGTDNREIERCQKFELEI